MTNPFATDALLPSWASVGVLKIAGETVEKSREQAAHHKQKAKYHRKVAEILTKKGFIFPASLHNQAATAHNKAAEITSGKDDDTHKDAIEMAADASSAAESATAAVNTGFTDNAAGNTL